MPAGLDLPNVVWVFLWNSAICSEGSAFPNRSSPDLLLWHASENLLASFFEYVRTACFGLLRNPLWSASRHCSSESVKSRPSKKKLFLRLMMSVILPLMVERERERESENDVAFSLLLPLHSHTQVIILHSPGKRGEFCPCCRRQPRPAGGKRTVGHGGGGWKRETARLCAPDPPPPPLSSPIRFEGGGGSSCVAARACLRS